MIDDGDDDDDDDDGEEEEDDEELPVMHMRQRSGLMMIDD